MAQKTQHTRFHIRSLDELRGEIERLGVDLPVTEDLGILSEPVAVGDRTAPNRFAVQPMEGFDADRHGAPGDLTFRRYTRYAAGGFGLIWIEATAVLDEARSNPGQLCLHEGTVDRFAALIAATRAAANERFGRMPVIVIQLTHSGRYSKPAGVPAPLIAHHSPVLDPRHNLPPDYPLVSDAYLDALLDRYVAAAALAARAGADGIDVKSCHRYLVSELLASFTREGRYGGSFENRTRLLREALARIRAEVPGVFVTTRMNAYDAIPHPYGFGVDREDWRKPDLTEPLALADRVRALGAPVLNVSIGNPYYNPHYGRPFDFAVAGFNVPDEHPLAAMGRFLAITRRVQESRPAVPVIGSGYSWVRQFMPNVAAAAIRKGWASMLGIGRGAFAYPDTPRDVLETGCMDPAKCCVTCSGCTQIMRDGGKTGCVVRDSAIYGPQYRLGRRFAVDRLQEEARRCRECEEATCRRGCPARIDIPAFLRAFADGDFRAAYTVLRQSNALPEMCGWVCPAEVQCEGSCVENIFCQRPLPIRDIQLVTCQIARRAGYAALRLPERQSGRRVAVVGGGPTGLAGAARLLEAGHTVRVFERGNRIGGTPDAIIPAERYADADAEIEAVFGPATKRGWLEVRLGAGLGRDVRLESLRREFDAVLLAMGLARADTLGHAIGVVDALTFLREAKRGGRPRKPGRVAVLGGGNTAMDAGLAAIELGADDVYLVYRRSFNEMPAWPAERQRFVEAGGHVLILTQPLGYETDDAGRLTGLRVARTELGQPDASGRRRPAVVPGTESVLRVDLVVEAIGQGLADGLAAAMPGVTLDERGLVRVAGHGSFATSLARVYAAGDIVNGGTTAVQGISEGMQAAGEIDRALRAGAQAENPTR